MSLFTFFASLTAWIAAAAAGEQPTVSRVVVQEELVMRIPVQPMRKRPLFHWEEKKGPKCLPAGAIRGAFLSGPSSVDFIMRDRSRVRARMDDDCPALDFYDGFYLESEDERICAKREEIRSREGSSCRIERFRTLVPKPNR